MPRIQSENARNRLGEVWFVLNPILNAAVFYLIFGVILKTSRGIENYVAFLITGVSSSSPTCSARSRRAPRRCQATLGLIRAFHFPRAVLPFASTAKQLMQLGFSLVVLIIIVLVTGEPITSRWLLIPITVALLSFFAAGVALITARITTTFNDFTNLLPFLLRAWLYMSGVFFSIQAFSEHLPGWAGRRSCCTSPDPCTSVRALLAARRAAKRPVDVRRRFGWAVLAFIGGFFYFFRAEGRYGRG